MFQGFATVSAAFSVVRTPAGPRAPTEDPLYHSHTFPRSHVRMFPRYLFAKSLAVQMTTETKNDEKNWLQRKFPFGTRCTNTSSLCVCVIVRVCGLDTRHCCWPLNDTLNDLLTSRRFKQGERERVGEWEVAETAHKLNEPVNQCGLNVVVGLSWLDI